MKAFYYCALFILWLLIATNGYASEKAPPTAYTIGPGDILEVSVWNNAALTKNVAVLPDGKFHFPPDR